MKKIPKLLVFLALTFVAFIAGWFYLFGEINQPQSKPIHTAGSEQKTAYLLIDYGETESPVFEHALINETTAFSILKDTLDKEDIPYETQQYDFGIFVQSINGFESTADMAWIYFVNGESGNVAADQYTLENGDEVEWRYVPPAGE